MRRPCPQCKTGLGVKVIRIRSNDRRYVWLRCINPNCKHAFPIKRRQTA